MNANKLRWRINKKSVSVCVHLGLIVFVLFSLSCSQLEKPKPEPFYAETAPPQKKEFRWSNGKIPKSFDPAHAAAPPESDIVRAVYEGLTDTDSKTLRVVPAAAVEWNALDDFKTWTFKLRKDARWSNGEPVTAQDFVRSWKRLAAMGDKVSSRGLLQNIVGLHDAAEGLPVIEPEESNVFSEQSLNQEELPANNQTDSNSNVAAAPISTPSASAANPQIEQKTVVEKPVESKFGVEAVDNFTLKISLVNPDKDFPTLVAHPIFRPVFGDGKKYETGKLTADVVTNGAFRIASVGQDGITLDRAENYWNKQTVELQRVRFVPTENAEKALAAYRAGEVDAVTNADFEPLALKLLTPYEDFRRTTYSALNFYEFNRNKPPFDDRRVREALAISIERERLTEDEMDGASLPALSFLPSEKTNEKQIVQDTQRAKTLLTESGYPDGANFPVVKLLVNRNNMQQRIARSVAKMWKRNLNVETEIVVKDSAELAAVWATDEFALLRRGAVLATGDETANMLALFPARLKPSVETRAINSQRTVQQNENQNAGASVSTPEQPKVEGETQTMATGENLLTTAPEAAQMILTEQQALEELPAIPLYFPTSYSLVKPYIQGFEINILDAPSLKDVRIDNSWQPKTAKGES
jgi:oligopeptide transport system substrate-binding protein